MEKQVPIIVTDYHSIEKIIERTVQRSMQNVVQQLKQQLPVLSAQPEHSLLIKKKEAAQILGVNYRTLQKLIQQGAIKTSPDGKKIVYQSLIDYVEGNIDI